MDTSILQRFRLISGHVKKITTLDDFLSGQVTDLYDVEMEQMKALPKLAAKLCPGPVKDVIDHHMVNMEKDAVLLKDIIKQTGVKVYKSGTYIIDEMAERAHKIIRNSIAGHIVETEIVLFIQYINHFEIANIYTLTGLANALRKRELIEMLEKMLRNKREADYSLARLSKERITGLHAL